VFFDTFGFHEWGGKGPRTNRASVTSPHFVLNFFQDVGNTNRLLQKLL